MRLTLAQHPFGKTAPRFPAAPFFSAGEADARYLYALPWIDDELLCELCPADVEPCEPCAPCDEPMLLEPELIAPCEVLPDALPDDALLPCEDDIPFCDEPPCSTPSADSVCWSRLPVCGV